MEYEYQYQHGSFAATASTSAPEASSRRKSSYLTPKTPPPVPSYPSQQHLYQQHYAGPHYEDPYPQQQQQHQQQHQHSVQPSSQQHYHENTAYMDLDTTSSSQGLQPSRQKPAPLRKVSNGDFDLFSQPPIMTAPGYGTTQFVSSSQQHISPPPYYATAHMPNQEIYNYNSGDKGGDAGDMSFVQQEPQQQLQQQHEQQHQQQQQQHHHHHASQHQQYYFATSDMQRGTQPVSQYYQDLPAAPVLTVTPRSKRPKSLAAHDFVVGGEQVYPQYIDGSRQPVPAKSRQSIGAIIPQVPNSWMNEEQQYQQQQQQLQQQAQKKQLSSRQSFHELQFQQRQRAYSHEEQLYHHHHHHHQEPFQQQQQYYQQQLAQQEYKTAAQGAVPSHPRGQNQNIGLDIPMSPNPPVTPSTTNTSNGSPMTALTSPQSSGRSSSVLLSQKIAPALPSSPSVSSHYRKKSFSSVPIPLLVPSDLSPMPPSQTGSHAGSPVTSPYGSPSKHNLSYMGMLSTRKPSSSEVPIVQPRDLYRRSESFGTLQARTVQTHSNNGSSSDLNNSLLSPSQGSVRDHPMRSRESMENDSRQGTMDSQQQNDSQTEAWRDSWREQEQYLMQMQQRDHSTREKHKRESFYAALENSNKSAGNISNYSGYQDEPRQPSKTHSRAASPHLPTGIPYARTKSRSSIPSTPTAEQRTRPTPPPRSRSRTPAGNNGQSTQPSSRTPQQPQVPQQYSGEIQPILRKSIMMVDDPMTSFAQRSDTHHSQSSDSPFSQTGTPQPRVGEAVPVPVADITKHLSGLEFREPGSVVQPLPADIPSAGTHTRQSTSGSLGSAQRRSIVFDVPNTPTRSHASGYVTDSNAYRMKDVGVAISGSKDRYSMFSSSSQGPSRKRGKTLSAMDPPKAKQAPTMLPPMFMSTTSRTSNIPPPMASRLPGSKIPSPSRGNSKDASSKPNSRLLSVNQPALTNQDVKTIRGGGGALEISSSRATNSALSHAAYTSSGGPDTSMTAGSSSSAAPKVKANRSLSSGILSGLSRRRSAAIEPVNVVGDASQVPVSEPTTPKQSAFSKFTSGSSSARQPSNGQLLGQSESKKSSTSGLRTPTAVKELRSSPSRSHSKNPAIMSNPINIYASNQPTPLYGQGPPSSSSAPQHAEPKSPMGTSSVSPFPPLSPYAALKLYGQYLSLYERAEIGEYPQVYYVGQNCRHKKPASMEASNSNFGFDDERGDYLIVNHDHIMFRYEILDMLGKGSFGQVAKCYDHKTGEYVAIKIIRNKKRFHCQAVVEVKILNNLNKWDPEDKHNLIRMTDNFYFRNHLCIASELLSINLYEFIKSNSFQGFSLGLIKRFCTQLLQTLELLSRHNVVHCDLKPENVLLKHPTKSSIKVIDFGSSCLENEKVYTYIQSRFYRSPEVILGMSYNMAIDMWSLGCILAELYTGYPLFPGENEQEQLTCIMEIQGVPDRYLIEKSSRKKLFFDSNGNPKLVVNSKGKRRKPGSKNLSHALKCNDVLFLDFISNCLIWDPEKRMKPWEGLQHEWISDVKAPTKPVYSPSPSDTSSGSRRKSSLFSGHSSRKSKSEVDERMALNSSQSSSSKASRTGANGNGTASLSHYGGANQSFGSSSYGGTSHIAKIYGGQQQQYQLPQYQQHQQQQQQQQQYSYQQQQQQQQQQQPGYTNGVYTNSGSTQSSSLSAAASRRLTVGDLGPSSYQHGSRKNATSMYVSSSSIGRAEY
ncbi:hypothetical protein BGZ67_004694 [Mortierella alpina]|nr:hypothetical protein BGZ67_004694 [Mortierella alpina]